MSVRLGTRLLPLRRPLFARVLMLLVLAFASVVSASMLGGSRAASLGWAAPGQVCPAEQAVAEQTSASNRTRITLWVYPIGKFGDPNTVDGFIAAFNERYPDIEVTVDYLDYAYGDDQVSAAISAGTAPDIVMEGPERIVSNWSREGVMADLSDLWTEEATADISAQGDLVVDACKGTDGVFYEYPLCMTAHCMAINYEVFEKAGALQYLDLEHRTWTTEGFIKACEKVAASGLVDTPGIVYCGGQGGDQGTRALVTNLYGARFTNEDHTAYTIDSAEGLKALQTLKKMTDEGYLSYDTGREASGELALFTQGRTAMTFAWNASNEAAYASDVDFTPYAMTFPTDQAAPNLCSGIWGFGVFDNGDATRIEAAKTFIRFLCDDGEQGRQSVRATCFSPVRASFADVYDGTDDEERMAEFGSMMRYATDYYNITPGWAAQRTAWWNMLQQMFCGTDPQEAVDWYSTVANNAIYQKAQSPVYQISKVDEKHVLFISSYSLSDPTVKEQIDGIWEGLGSDVYLHYEFMDSMTVGDDGYVASFYQYICDKYSRISGLGAIIVGDDNALQMVIRYQKGFFRGIPVIYESVKSPTLTQLADSLGMMGVPTGDTIRENLDLACRLYPHATRVLAITDESAVGRALTSRFKAVENRYASIRFECLDTSAMDPDQIASTIGSAGEDTILLYMNFTSDKEGKAYPYKEALKLVTDNAKTPVFTLSWLDEGSLGSIAIDSKAMGKRAGQIADGFLNEATTIDTEALEAPIETTATFDYSVMKEFELAKSSFPAKVTYENDVDNNIMFNVIIAALAVGVLLLGGLLIRFVRDNRRRKRNESQLQKVSDMLRTEAELDVLTGLGNRRLFDREFLRSTQSDRPFTLYILDLDNFKHVNDTYGHLMGDQVLRETGDRLLKLKNRSFVPYRYGGDEFAIMVFSDDPGVLKASEQQLLKSLQQTVHSDGADIVIGVSIGGATFPSDATGTDELIHCADQALYTVKTHGKRAAKRYSACKKG